MWNWIHRRAVSLLHQQLRQRGLVIRPLAAEADSVWCRATSTPIPCHPFLAVLMLQCPDPYFIQIGAHDGISFDDLFDVVKRYHLPGLVVEPLPDLFTELVKNYASQPQVTPVNAAIDLESGRRTMYRVPTSAADSPSFASGIGSLDPNHHRRSGVSGKLVCEESVDCITFDELVQRHQVERIDYLQIDAEGYDGRILSSIDLSRFRPSVIRFEHSALSQSEKEETAIRLTRHSYVLVADRENVFAISESVL